MAVQGAESRHRRLATERRDTQMATVIAYAAVAALFLILMAYLIGAGGPQTGEVSDSFRVEQSR